MKSRGPMKSRVIVDAGPLVAFIMNNEPHSQWAGGEIGRCIGPLLTCEAVVSECLFLLQHRSHGTTKLRDLFHRGLIRCEFNFQQEQELIFQLMEKYRDLPMSFADACLVRMSEQLGGSSILTLDQQFRVYRRLGRSVIPLIIPPQKKE